MEVMVNSVWKVSDTSEKFRIIYLAMDGSLAVGFPLLDDRQKICKPFALHLDELNNQILTCKIVKDHFPIPGIMLQSEESIRKKDVVVRDQRFECIQDLVCDREFIIKYCLAPRSKLVTLHASNRGFDLRTVYRALRDYWRYGLSKNALIPLRTNQGGPGKERSEGTEKKGRPPKSSVFGFTFSSGINITASDKAKIKAGYKEYYAKGNSKFLSGAYEDTLNLHYADEIRRAESARELPLVPSFTQFKYWGEKRVDKMEVNIGRNPLGDFDRNQRGLTESMHSADAYPGKVFEIDATTADVHIVSPLNRNINLGRPTVYSIVDRASRMIIGLYLSLGYPSWEVARLSLLHAFSPKVGYAKRYGIDIIEADWPCHHQPETLIGDRGEMRGIVPGAVIPTTGITLDIAPVYRADIKGIVESRFGIFNDESLHELPGTTKGRQRERTETDPRELAVLTLDEVTNILIHDVLKHNNTHTFDDLATVDLVKANLPYTPLNFWNFYVGAHRHFLREKPLSEMKALLLTPIFAKVTKYGIKNGEIYYTCELAEKENWFASARAEKEWHIEARFDENVISELYIKPDKSSEFIACHLTGRSQRFKKLHHSDVLYMIDWKRSNKKGVDRSAASLTNFENKNEIIKSAKAIKQIDQETHKTSKRSNVINIRENRRIEKQRLKEEEQKHSLASLTDRQKNREASSPDTIQVSEVDLTMFARLWEESDHD